LFFDGSFKLFPSSPCHPSFCAEIYASRSPRPTAGDRGPPPFPPHLPFLFSESSISYPLVVCYSWFPDQVTCIACSPPLRAGLSQGRHPLRVLSLLFGRNFRYANPGRQFDPALPPRRFPLLSYIANLLRPFPSTKTFPQKGFLYLLPALSTKCSNTLHRPYIYIFPLFFSEIYGARIFFPSDVVLVFL